MRREDSRVSCEIVSAILEAVFGTFRIVFGLPDYNSPETYSTNSLYEESKVD